MEVWNKKTRQWENSEDQKKITDYKQDKTGLSLKKLKELRRAELSRPDYDKEQLDYLDEEIEKLERKEANAG